MSILPEIGKGGLVSSGSEQEAVPPNVPDVTIRKKKGNKSLLELSQNFTSIRHDDGKKLRSRSYEPSSGDEREDRTRKKAKIDRSKSLGPLDRRKELRGKQPVGKGINDADENNNSTIKGKKRSRIRVRFDSSSEESYEKNVPGKAPRTQVSTPAPTGVQYKIGERQNPASMVLSPISNDNGSPVGPRKRAQPGTHQARLETTRTKARVWAETASDPGPPVKYIVSIDNDKVLKGQQIDPRRGRGQPDNARNRHAQYISQDNQDGRPKAADKGRRLKSLPANKEQHASEAEDRPVISAPAKDQGQLETPMPKINTLLPAENKASPSTETQPGTSRTSNQSVSPRKPIETQQKREPRERSVSPQKPEVKVPAVSQPKREPDDQTGSPRKSESKEPSISPRKQETKESSISPRKLETKESSISPLKKETKEPTVVVQKKEPETKQTESDKKMAVEKIKPPPRAPSKVSGMVDHGGEEGGKKSEGRRKLPADDHGLVNPAPFPIPVPKSTDEQLSLADKNFKYYASERERALQAERNKMADDSPRVTSEKSAKTDKSWTTVKTKNTDSKLSSYSYPAGPTKSQTTYEMSSVDNSDKKRREVTIVDPKYLRKMNKNGEDDDDDEPFMHEYEYAHHHFRHKNFKDMTDEEKIEYFRDQLKMKPEQIRELTFHPKITEPTLIHHAYTGIDTVNWRARVPTKSGRRPKSRKFSVYKKVSVVPPNQRKSAMLTKLQGVVYRHINKVYGASPRDTRERQFFEKLAQIQIEDMQHRYEQLAEKERRLLESKFRQREQLRRLRRKFEDDSWRRFMTQYVTSKVVEAECRNRAEYGLPNDLEDRPRRHPQTIRNVNQRRSQFAITPKRMYRKNEKKYANLFRFNTGPIPKTNGKQLKFEGFDTVYLDTEDEHGRPIKKKQNVDDLMKEARRILDQTDGEETDVEETPRKSQPERRRPERRHQYNRSRARMHIADDKSYKSTQTQSTRSKSTIKPPPKTMKELMSQRKSFEAPTNRYKASSFTAMKADLVKDSDLLNKNERLQKIGSGTPKVETATVKSDVSKPKSVRDEIRDENKSPDRSPVRTRDQSPVKTESVTKTTVTHVQVESSTNETDDKKGWKVKDGSVYLEEPETQMAIETAKDKIEDKKPSRAPSRASQKIGDKANAPAKSIAGSRAQSRISFRGKQEQNVVRETRPPRAPSRVSVMTTESKTVDSNTNKHPGRQSRASILPPSTHSPARSLPREDRKKTETAFMTETETETVTKSNGKPDKQVDEISLPKSVRASQATIKQVSRHNSISSTQPNKHVSGRTSVVGIATTSNGRVSPTVEKQIQPPKRRESYMDQLKEKTQRKESMVDRNSLKGGEQPGRNTDSRQMNGHVSPASRKTDSGKKAPKTVVSKTVNVTEDVTETTNSDVSRTRPPVKRHGSTERKRSVDHRDSDVFSSRKPDTDDRRSEINENKEKPKSKVKQSQKKETQKQRKAPTRRRSRSRTPQRDHTKMNGHDDYKMNIAEYETMGHDGNRPSRRSDSVEGGNRGRRRSTSRGRKTSQSKGRKRSTSSERKKGKKGKSRFPDIKKKDGKFEITARSPTQKVSRNEKVEENITERIITPKPTGANQWKDLVEKYLRQPSPKVGKTDDRSLLDSNIDDDDDDEEMDIFARAQMKYHLSVDKTDDEDSDNE